MFRRNRWIAALLSAALVLTMTPAGVIAAEQPEAAQAENQTEEEVQENTEISDDTSLSSEEGADRETSESSAEENEDSSEESQDQAVDAAEEQSEETAENTDAAAESEEQDAASLDTEASAAQDGMNAAQEEIADPSQEEAAAVDGAEAQKQEKRVPAVWNMEAVTPETESTDGDGIDADEKYEFFLDAAFYGTRSAGKTMLKASGRLKNRLNDTELLIYEKLVEAAEEIARGERDNGIVDIPTAEITGGMTDFTAEDLGLDYIIDEAGQWNPGIDAALVEKYPIDYDKIQNILNAECPYEMFPLTGGISHPVDALVAYVAAYDGESWLLSLSETFTVALVPNANFALDSGDEFAIDAEKIRNVLHAADTAKKIVSNAEGMSDYYKLSYYKERICDLVSYDDDARAQGSSYEDKCAWSLLNVFDGDSSTNVVCEGYSEAFQYLCDLTSFSGDTYAYSVTGDLDGGTGAGPHKWNIVHIDGENYIADITNSDEGSVGCYGDLFLKGMNGSVEGSYYRDTKVWTEEIDNGNGVISIVTHGGDTVIYTYDSGTRSIYTEAELTLADHDYGAPAQASTDDKVCLKGMSLYLTDKIGMRVYVKPADGYALSPDDSIVFTCNDKTVTQKVSEAGTRTIKDYNGEDVDVYVFGFELWTKQMTDEVSFHMVVDDEPGTDKTYSVRSYADEILRGDYSEEEKGMVRAMLNYGGYAQKCFEYSTEKLANDGIFSELVDPVTLEDPDLSAYQYTMEHAEDTKGFKLKQASLILGTDVSLVYTFKLEDGKSTADYDFVVEGSNKTPVIGYNTYFESDCVMIENITPKELDQMYTLKVTPKGESTSVYTLTYGPFSYCKSKIAKGKESVRNLCKSIYYYWEAASKLQ